MSFLVIGSSNGRPMSRLMAKKVRSGLVTPCRLAGCPTRRSPSSEKATIEGVVRAPSAFSMTLGVDPSMTQTQEFVVPRSIPMTFAIRLSFPRKTAGSRSDPAMGGTVEGIASQLAARSPTVLEDWECLAAVQVRAAYRGRFFATQAAPAQRGRGPRMSPPPANRGRQARPHLRTLSYKRLPRCSSVCTDELWSGCNRPIRAASCR